MTLNKAEALRKARSLRGIMLRDFEEGSYGVQLLDEITAFINSQDGWEPIETAPKDGEFDALVIDVFGNIFQGLKGLNGRWSAENPRGGGDYYINTGKLTHWMPLPPAPAADDREA